MTPEEIRLAIALQPELLALAHGAEPCSLQIAEALSLGRVKYLPTEVGTGLILSTLGIDAGNALLDKIYTDDAFRYVKPLLSQGRLDISTPLVREMLPTLTSAENAAMLVALAAQPDPVDEHDVRRALYADSGELLV